MASTEMFRVRDGKICCRSDFRADCTRNNSKFEDPFQGITPESGSTLHHLVPWGALGRVLNMAIAAVRADAQDDEPLRKVIHVSQGTRSTALFHQGKLRGTNFALMVKTLRSLSTSATDVSIDILDGYEPTEGTVSVSSKRKAKKSAPVVERGNERVFDLIQYWCWMPGNLFAGVNSRSDDPGDWGFDAPPMASTRHGKEALSLPLTKGRVLALFEFFQFLDMVSDDELAGAQRATALEFLDALIPFELSDPARLLVTKTATHWVQTGNDRRAKLIPMELSDEMKRHQFDQLCFHTQTARKKLDYKQIRDERLESERKLKQEEAE
jgi:hypothetical protein